MNEVYVKFETAQRLKQKGFDWFTYTYYTKDNVDETPYFGRESLCSDNFNGQSSDVNDFWYSAPTQQMAMRWLREEKRIYVYPIPITGFNYIVAVYVEQENETPNRIVLENRYNTYEDAVEAALEYCLTNLV